MQVHDHPTENLLELPFGNSVSGSVYTPQALADWVAEELLGYSSRSNTVVRRVLDPACGDGMLLSAIRRLSPSSNLIGIDIDRKAAHKSWSNLSPPTDVRTGDALDPKQPWPELESTDLIIMNPPWGTPNADGRNHYRKVGYALAAGQFDIFELFVERATNEVPEGTHVALILPDSVFESEHQALRNLLLQHTLLLIARLGEGLFPEVYRGAVVIILRSGGAPNNHAVDCLLIGPESRKGLKAGVQTLKRIKKTHSHSVPQARFATNPRQDFDINYAEVDAQILDKFEGPTPFNWQRHVILGRGIEIGRYGETVHCDSCGANQADPGRANNGDHYMCSHCNALTVYEEARRKIVTTIAQSDSAYPLIVGEDVDRYNARSSRYIELGVSGIRYKPIEHFQTRKLLLRKTGVGIRAAVDESGAAVNQSVYYIVARHTGDDWIVDYLQGVINSRPILAWYLAVTGENQWRSFPYWTATKIKDLRVPDPYEQEGIGIDAKTIAELARRARNGDVSAELEVDELVLQMYNLGRIEQDWIGTVLADAQQSIRYFSEMTRTVRTIEAR